MEVIKKDGQGFDIVGYVLRTENKNVFKHIDGNRTTNELHYKRLKASIKDNDLKMPIMVNNEMKVVDGQHRLRVYRELDKPVDFIIGNGWGIKEVQTINQNQKNWTMDDFMKTYCMLNKKEYLVYSDFKEVYPFTHDVTMSLMIGVTGKPRFNHYEDFRNGVFKCNLIDKATDMANKITMVADTHPEIYRRSNFIYAMIRAMKTDGYNHTHFIKMLKRYPSLLESESTIPKYIYRIDKIYNKLIKNPKLVCPIYYSQLNDSTE
jgi:gamma-glutamylcyclotransferase (GGCT)/AIG2-like uncharacterized protein YtfP